MKSSCADSRCGCLDRRQFLKLTGAAAFSLALTSPAGAVAGPFEPRDIADHFVPVDKKLTSDWLVALVQKGEPEWYAGKDLQHIGMPIGGICAGQLYLSGDGTLTHWDIFNDSGEDARSGTHYQVLPPAVAPVKQQFKIQVRTGGQTVTRTLDRTGFPGVRFRGEYPIATVRYEDAASAAPAFPLEISLEAFSPFIPLNALDSALPATILQFKVRNPGRARADVALAGSLQNAVSYRTGAVLEGTRENRLMKARNVAMILGSAMAAPPETVRKNARPNIVLADFEQQTYGDWQVEGEAPGTGPAPGTLLGQQKVSGFQGRGLVNTFIDGDKPQGKIVSPEFTIERHYLNFLVGGGAHRDQTCVNLVVEGKVRRTATGRDNERLQWNSWDVREFAGKPARLQIVDQHSGGWGHINVDQIELNDAPRRTFEGALEDQSDYGTMGLAILGTMEGLLSAADLGEGSLDAVLGQEPGVFSNFAAAQRTRPFGQELVGAIGRRFQLEPGAETTVSFLVAWHFPNLKPQGNRYAGRFANAWAVATHVADQFGRLRAGTRKWRDTWYDSTLPWWLLDRLFAPTSILASATCQWWGNGRFWAWEGVRCCAGTCAHVWNYAHALARLFPDLERSIREMQDFGTGFVESTGAINFRGESNDFWAGDSQGGTALKCLREHQMSTDAAFLRRNWPRIKQSVEFLIKEDGNNDGLIEGSQHNTYDINFFGANTMVGSLYLGALRAAEVLATEAGDLEFAGRCRKIFEAGSALSVERLFNGEYFVQTVDLAQHPRHQYAEGCLADQLFGQGWAHQVGLGYLYPKDKVRSALKAIWTYNWAPDIAPQNKAHPPQRWFARPGEAGLFTCTWPKSKHLGPESVLYRDEIWTGIEYQVAGHMAWEGMITEALAICRGVYERYQPAKQNPWNEVECGDHYARAMASYGVFLALCGFECDGSSGRLGFAPRMSPENFRAAFTTAEAWGTFRQSFRGKELQARVTVKWGQLTLRTFALALPENAKLSGGTFRVGEKTVEARFVQNGSRVTAQLAQEVSVKEGETVGVVLEF